MNHRNLSVVFLYTTPAAVQSCANSLAFSVQKPKLKLIYDDTTENVNEQKTDLSLYFSCRHHSDFVRFFHAHLVDNLCLPHHRQNGRQSFGFRTGSRLRLYLYGNGRYWLINLACALIASLIIQYFVIGHGAGIYTILYRAAAFLIVVYFLNLLKIILAK